MSRRLEKSLNALVSQAALCKMAAESFESRQAVPTDGVGVAVPIELDTGRMKLSRTVTYAIFATLQLADSDSQVPIPCSHLAAEGHMPERFLLQILRSLVTHGILQSTRGVDGGYSLERSPRDISLLEIIEAIDGPIAATLPTYGGAERARHETKLREALEQVATTSRRQLHAIKLSNLLGTSRIANTA